MNYGIIGNHNTVALISKQGSIDWFCFPRFDSPSVFAKLLDENKGGFFCLPPSDNNYDTNQTYVQNTNIIETKMDVFTILFSFSSVSPFSPVVCQI